MSLSQQKNWIPFRVGCLQRLHFYSPLTEGYSICHPHLFLYLNTLSSSLSGTSGGKLNPPPAPPARSPTTELSSRSQQIPGWTQTQQPGGQLRNGSLHIMGKRGHQLPVGRWFLAPSRSLPAPGACFARAVDSQ